MRECNACQVASTERDRERHKHVPHAMIAIAIASPNLPPLAFDETKPLPTEESSKDSKADPCWTNEGMLL